MYFKSVFFINIEFSLQCNHLWDIQTSKNDISQSWPGWLGVKAAPVGPRAKLGIQLTQALS